jgi:hypothetical protein
MLVVYLTVAAVVFSVVWKPDKWYLALLLLYKITPTIVSAVVTPKYPRSRVDPSCFQYTIINILSRIKTLTQTLKLLNTQGRAWILLAFNTLLGQVILDI